MRYGLTLSVAISLWIGASTATGAEFADTDIFPFFGNIVFSKTAVGFPVNHREPAAFGPFIFTRDSRTFLDVTWPAFEKAFPDWKGQIQRAADQHGFAAKGAYCGEGEGGNKEKLYVGGKLVPVPINVCASISSLQVIGDQLWLGTLQQGEGATYAAEGVVVLSRDDWRHLATVSLPGAVSVLRVDPYSGDVWVATQRGIFRINPQIKLVSKHYYHYDLDPQTGQSRLLLASEVRKSNPLAVIMRDVPFEGSDRKALYGVARAIPEETLYRFSLYDFYMCCQPGEQFHPAEMNVLVPFFVKAAKLAPLLRKKSWYQAICQFDDKRATRFLLEEAQRYDQSSEYILLSCLRKYGLEREASQAAIDHKDRVEQSRKAQADRKLAELAKNYFVLYRPGIGDVHFRASVELCSLVRDNPDYIGRVVALFDEHGVLPSRDVNFFGNCLRSNMTESGFELFLPVVAKALQTTSSPELLFSACEATRQSQKDYLTGMVIPVLYARRTAEQYMQAYAWAAINPFRRVYESCAGASHQVIDGEDGIGRLLAELAHHKRVERAAFDTLRELTGENFGSVEEWQEWRESHRRRKQ